MYYILSLTSVCVCVSLLYITKSSSLLKSLLRMDDVSILQTPYYIHHAKPLYKYHLVFSNIIFCFLQLLYEDIEQTRKNHLA